MIGESILVADLYPSLLQPEGDHGNSVALTGRARQRGLAATSAVVHPGDEVPRADIYLIGGSEDADLPECVRRLQSDADLPAAVDRGAVVLGVGAGYVALSSSFEDAGGSRHLGLGLLDVRMRWDVLASGPVVTCPDAELDLPALSGYEFHYRKAEHGARARALFALELGVGDGRTDDGVFDGCRSGRVLGTWLHGPLLPRNPELVDLILRWCWPPSTSDQPAHRADAGPVIDDRLAHSVRRTRISEAHRHHASTH